jgi:thiamine-monophosphate kinase
VGELSLIEWIRARFAEGLSRPATGKLIVGPGDDVAVIGLGREKVALKTDVVVAGVHFEAGASARAVGWKAMARSISDLAATAAMPSAAVAAVALGEPGGRAWAEELYLGLEDCARRYGSPVVGGDFASASGPTVVAVSVVGRFDCEPVLRKGAAPGDALYVTGELGGSILGRHLSFEPRLAEGLFLGRSGLGSAMIDVSDGLATDLRHLCRESSVGAVIEEANIPISDAARKRAAATRHRPLDHALADGEDYELLFTVRPAEVERLEREWPGPARIKRIGGMTAPGSGILIRGSGGTERPLLLRGFEHGLPQGGPR